MKYPLQALKDFPGLIPQKMLMKLYKMYPATTYSYAKSLLPKNAFYEFIYDMTPHNGKKLPQDKYVSMSFDEAWNNYLTVPTRKQLIMVSEYLDIKWYLVQYEPIIRNVFGDTKVAHSIQILGKDKKGNYFQYVRRETADPQAGQTKVYINGKSPVAKTSLLSASKKSIDNWIKNNSESKFEGFIFFPKKPYKKIIPSYRKRV